MAGAVRLAVGLIWLVTGAVPVLTAIEPPGVTLGETAVWTVTGRALADVKQCLISGTGVEVVAIEPASDEAVRVRVQVRRDALPGYRELRMVGPSGISNLLLFRLDDLPQSQEAEPNDHFAAANLVAMDSAVAGVLRPQDVDQYAFQGRAAMQVTIEVEARRLGSPIVPVARLFAPSGASLAQSQPLRDGSRDCRLTFVLPADGRYVAEVRDALYRGSETAWYRLRLNTGGFATGLFPLGGPRGATIAVTAAGGTLIVPLHKTVTLADEAGAIVAPGPFTGPGGRMLVPGHLVAGSGPEIDEPPPGSPSRPTNLPFGATANGRIDRPGEVDRYSVVVTPGESIRVEVQAAGLGSWLDSVVTLVDSHGTVIAEDDDRGIANRPAGSPGKAASDSRLDAVAPADGVLVVAIADRFGTGGPEYAYRLSVGTPRPDFAVALRPGGGANTSGALNLLPGTNSPLRFLIVAEGRLAPITVRAEGLPPGVSAEPVLIRLSRPSREVQGGPMEGTLILKVEPGSGPAIGSLRVVATTRDSDTTTMIRWASATLTLAAMPTDDPRPPPMRVVTELPVMIVAPDQR